MLGEGVGIARLREISGSPEVGAGLDGLASRDNDEARTSRGARPAVISAERTMARRAERPGGLRPSSLLTLDPAFLFWWPRGDSNARPTV